MAPCAGKPVKGTAIATELRVPVARHDDLGILVAANLETDEELRKQLSHKDVKAGLRCGSCGQPVQFVNATLRTRHFRHIADAACVWGPESSWHVAIKDAFAQAFEYWRDRLGEGWELEVREELPREGHRLWQADVACVARGPNGTTRRVMVEVQQSPQRVDATAQRTALRQADGWDVLWVHYNPDDPVAPRWLRDGGPSVGLDVAPAGHLRVASGYLEHQIFRQSDVPTLEPPVPGEDDDIVIDDWDTDPQPLTFFVQRWLASSGLLTDPVEGRRGLAWVKPWEHAPLDPDVNVLVDTYEVYTWLQDQAEGERRAAARRHLAEVTAAKRDAERRAARSLQVITPLLDLLQVRQPQPVRYPGTCFCCGASIRTGDVAAMMKNELTSMTWRLLCGECSTSLGI